MMYYIHIYMNNFNMRARVIVFLSFFLAIGFLNTNVASADDLAFTGSTSFVATTGLVEHINDLQISGTTPASTPVKLRVSNGTITMSTITGLTFTSDTTGSILEFSGTLADINNALATLTYVRVGTGSDTLEASLVNPGEVFFSGTNHLYEYIASTLTWTQAKTAAENLPTRYGANGYLVTITSAEENDFVAARLSDAGWMGASDQATEDDWKWVTGPETGDSFWFGNVGGYTLPGKYSNWNNGSEPNDSGGDEDCGQFLSGGSGDWNDLPCTGETLPGYVAEFGAPGNMPVVVYKNVTITTTRVPFSGTGSGTNMDPYLITTCAQILEINNNLDQYYKLTINLDCTSNGNSIIVGSADTPFTGSFDGDEHTITIAISEETEQDNIGLFSYVDGGNLSDLGVLGNVTGSGNNTGMVFGYFTNSTAQGITSSGTVSGVSSVGGIAGYIQNASISDSYSTSNITAGSYNAGGFAGSSGCGATFTRTYATGNVSGVNSVGGFSGSDGCEGPGSTIHESYATGNATGTGDYVGGFIGNSSNTTIIDAYAFGNISGGTNVGGFYGVGNNGSLTNVYAKGTVTGIEEIGGLIGFSNPGDGPTISHSFFDTTVNGLSDSNGGTPTITPLMKTQSTFTDATWDFEGIWGIDANNNGYPHFQWQTFGGEDTTAPVLTEITGLSGNLPSNSDGVYRFSTNEACEVNVTPPTSTTGTVEPLAEEVTVDHPIGITLQGMIAGGTYSYSVSCVDSSGNHSNTLHVGPYTVFNPRSNSSGGYNQVVHAQWLAQQNNTQVLPVNTCSADQILTQNLKSGARNGKYNSYTNGIVKEVKILQGHMNRLGFNSGPVDGILGPLTDGAIKRMQKYLGTYQDGKVGPITRGLINKSCGSNTL